MQKLGHKTKQEFKLWITMKLTKSLSIPTNYRAATTDIHIYYYHYDLWNVVKGQCKLKDTISASPSYMKRSEKTKVIALPILQKPSALKTILSRCCVLQRTGNLQGPRLQCPRYVRHVIWSSVWTTRIHAGYSMTMKKKKFYFTVYRHTFYASFLLSYCT